MQVNGSMYLILSEKQYFQIHQAALRVLGQAGVQIDTHRFRKDLSDGGCKASKNRCAIIPRDSVAQPLNGNETKDSTLLKEYYREWSESNLKETAFLIRFNKGVGVDSDYIAHCNKIDCRMAAEYSIPDTNNKGPSHKIRLACSQYFKRRTSERLSTGNIPNQKPS